MGTMQVGLVDMLYRKALLVSSSARTEYGIGAIVNLQSNDASKLWTLPQYLHMLWSAPMQVQPFCFHLSRVHLTSVLHFSSIFCLDACPSHGQYARSSTCSIGILCLKTLMP